MSKAFWQDSMVSPCGTFHLLRDKPLYSRRYNQVMKYHAPGLAPVRENTVAFHIDTQGLPAYLNRFVETFGFYNGLAAVRDEEGCFHITPQGDECYSIRYAWCGNFQEGFCVVKDQNGFYFHINCEGQKAYPQRYPYVGDFKEGCAVVCSEQGLHSHIDCQGNLIHGHWFLDLDVFHKGFARAKDNVGWFHIDKSGKSLYKERYAAIEPFYNGVARVEKKDGALRTINNQGGKIAEFRTALQKPWQQLSADMVGFWRTETIAMAVRLKVFDFFPATTLAIALELKLSSNYLERLLRALWELDLIDFQNDSWKLTDKGKLIAPQQQTFLAAAAIMWSDVNAGNWKRLSDYICAGSNPTHLLFKATVTDDKLFLYHRAIDGYALEDFASFSALNIPVNWSSHQKIIGVGRTAKTWLEKILQNNSHQEAILLGEEYVLKHIDINPAVTSRYHLKIHNVLQPWPETADAIFLPKILHYWSDDEVVKILKNARKALSSNGKIYLLEMLLSKTHPDGSLLDLNMLAESGGRLRFLADWEDLLAKSELKLQKNFIITPWLNVLVIEP
jgi:hypothetical protein